MRLPSARHHVFVYGTLRPGGYYHGRLIEGRTVHATPAWVRGQLYALSPGYPGMRPGERRVEGDVLSFDEDALLADLDQLEGYDPKRTVSEDFEYTREPCDAFAPDGSLLSTVWAYWLFPSRLSQYNGVPVDSWDHLSDQRRRFVTIAAHEPSFPVWPRVRSGESVAFLRYDRKHPGWFFGRTTGGVEGFFPVPWFVIDEAEGRAVALRDYDARELAVAVGWAVELEALVGSWALVQGNSQRGWIPLACLADTPS